MWAWVERHVARHLLVQRPLRLGVRRWRNDLQHHELIAGRLFRDRQPTTLQAQFLTTARPAGILRSTATAQCGTLSLPPSAASHGVTGRFRKTSLPVHLIPRMRLDRDFEKQVAGRPTVETGTALPGQADAFAAGHAARDLDLQIAQTGPVSRPCASYSGDAQLQSKGGTVECILEADLDLA